MNPLKLLDRIIQLANKFEQTAEGYTPFTPLNLVYRNLDRRVGSMLDLGCGWGAPMRFINRQKRFFTVGLDVFPPYLEECRQQTIHDEYVLSDIRRLPFRPRSFDTVLCLRVLEHLTLDEGEKLLAEMEDIARRQVAIITPAYAMEQTHFHDNPYQEHRSAWSLAQLKQRGYRVWPNGLRNVQFDTEKMGYLQKGLALFGHLLWVASGPLARVFPALAGAFVAVKNVDTGRVAPNPVNELAQPHNDLCVDSRK